MLLHFHQINLIKRKDQSQIFQKYQTQNKNFSIKSTFQTSFMKKIQKKLYLQIKDIQVAENLCEQKTKNSVSYLFVNDIYQYKIIYYYSMNQRTMHVSKQQNLKIILSGRKKCNINGRQKSSKLKINKVQCKTQIQIEDQLLPSSNKLTIESPLFSKRFISLQRIRKPDGYLNQNDNFFKNKIMKKNDLTIREFTTKNNQNQLQTTATTIKRNQDFINPHITAESYLVMKRKNKKIILSHQIQVKRQIASNTKLMTALTVLHICQIYQIDINSTIVTVKKQSAEIQGTSAGLHEGDQLNVIDLLYGMFLPSGNDSAMALAQHFGKFLSFASVNEKMRSLKSKDMQQDYNINYNLGSVKLFVFKMNKLAHELGLENSHFQNPTGLQDTRSYSTARDIGYLSIQCIQNGILRTIMEKKSYSCSVYNNRFYVSKTYTWKNTNKLLWRRRQCFGLKTGKTPLAGPCLTSTFKIQNNDIIIVVLKSLNSQQRFNDSEKLYSWYKRQYLQI